MLDQGDEHRGAEQAGRERDLQTVGPVPRANLGALRSLGGQAARVIGAHASCAGSMPLRVMRK